VRAEVFYASRNLKSKEESAGLPQTGTILADHFLESLFFPTMLEVSNLKCVRGERQLFAGVEFRLESGKLLYLRGANGAGKTSLLRLLCGLSPAEAGQILWNGVAIDELGEIYRQDLFYLGHHNALQEALTVNENLAFYGALAGAIPSEADTANALGRLGLRGCQTRLVRHLSQGQKRRVALSRLMLTRAKLWVLDEPFVPWTRRPFNCWQIWWRLTSSAVGLLC
jgi:heme exporter protein A